MMQIRPISRVQNFYSFIIFISSFYLCSTLFQRQIFYFYSATFIRLLQINNIIYKFKIDLFWEQNKKIYIHLLYKNLKYCNI